MKNDLIENDMAIEPFCVKYGINMIRNYEDVTTTTNITYFNKTRVRINKLVRANIIKKPFKLMKGDPVVLKKRIDGDTNMNEKYTITNMTSKNFTVSDGEYEVTYDNKHMWQFDFDYANTCHSLQGCSTSDNLTIFDANSPHVDKFWLWTSITRVRNLSQLNVFIHGNSEVRAYNFSKMMQYFAMKVENYKEQDAQAGRKKKKDEDYVDAKWILDTFKTNRKCMHPECGAPFEFDENYNSSNLTVQRWDSKERHVKPNCLLYCVDCNRKVKDFNYEMYA